MPIELKMPALSPTMEEGTLAKWLVKEGDKVASGDILAEIETDKATMEFEAVDEGTIAKILVPEGSEGVKVGAPIAIIAGVITQLIVIFVGDMKFELAISVTAMVIGMVIAVLAALIYQFFVFAVDYTRTEYLQYEDDEYHYYVKAVPKIAVSAPDVKVQRIYARKTAKTDKKTEH
jgi:hypothetical protein